MRWQAVIVLFALAFTIAVPPFCRISIDRDHDDRPVLVTVNVCHAAAPALSSNGDMPCVHECPCTHPPVIIVESFEPAAAVFSPVLLSFRYDRPPKARA